MEGITMQHTRIGLAIAPLLALVACTYYGYPAPGAPASYERSFYAAADAMRDQGVVITAQEANTGTVAGTAGSDIVTATVRQQGDGSVRVEFNAANPRDTGLLDRISRSYDRRMGR
ncbi:hypothetical protein VSR17_21555 [Cupriavidus taiwanensis]|uniref:hypothetical protein n=1 Tax=Cupriavidus taiwanensis TaxID=164546 RepID=UPI000E176722|nr:hypothetical protein [Cupriavidus taiwanensis]SOZ33449.1 conserved hypothetical protein [Cupriavidus taiwanensis]SPA38216.1 conserved hypothetical protein [Cupriavidus taiwanensis]SPA43921.1 conserved hypothetical protein [Cupriavidus taiwanensis]